MGASRNFCSTTNRQVTGKAKLPCGFSASLPETVQPPLGGGHNNNYSPASSSDTSSNPIGDMLRAEAQRQAEANALAERQRIDRHADETRKAEIRAREQRIIEENRKNGIGNHNIPHYTPLKQVEGALDGLRHLDPNQGTVFTHSPTTLNERAERDYINNKGSNEGFTPPHAANSPVIQAYPKPEGVTGLERAHQLHNQVGGYLYDPGRVDTSNSI